MSVCLQWMDPIFSSREVQVLNSLKSIFRVGKYTEQVLACHIAQLVAIEDIRNQMKSIAAAGDNAASQIIDREDKEE